ncbi:hypothetical protein [Halolamina sp.]|jgi:hypothetical protein|uniref:hypothetical protein n=1 Tax=Halolamina sp. TaxID=1940283 RepID=UPI0035667414
MAFRNRDGTTVDVVPFVVSCGSLFLLLYSFGPLYLQALGLGLLQALGVTTAIFAATVVAAYRRQVTGATPMLSGEVPASLRFRRLFYLMLIIAGIVLLLSLPLVGG